MSIRLIGQTCLAAAPNWDSLNIGNDESGWVHPNNEDNAVYSSSWDDDELNVHIKRVAYFTPSAQPYIRIGSCSSEGVNVWNDSDEDVRCSVDDIQSGSSNVSIPAGGYHSFNTNGHSGDIYLYFYVVETGGTVVVVTM